MEQKGAGPETDINGSGNLALIDFSTAMQPGEVPGTAAEISFDERPGHIVFSEAERNPDLLKLSPDVKGESNAGLIELSEIIDAFGIDSTHPEWDRKYRKMDFNNNGVIDIEDIAYAAKNI